MTFNAFYCLLAIFTIFQDPGVIAKQNGIKNTNSCWK